MIQIIPAVLATSEERYKNDMSKLDKCSLLQNGWVHIDFMDKIFVPNKSIEPSVISKYPIGLNKEAHLMIQHPGPNLIDYIKQEFKRIIIHIESDDNTGHDDLLDNLYYLEDEGIENGLAIKTDTPIERLIPYLTEIDVVLIMSIEPGFQGQPFIKESLERIKEVVRLRDKYSSHVKIGVDGSVRDQNARQIVEAGADYLVVGSYLLKGDIDKNLEKLWEATNG